MRSRYLAPAIRIAAWTICSVAVWFVLLVLVGFVGAIALPFRLETSASYQPASRGYQRIDVDAFSEVLAGDDIAHVADVTVTLTKSDSTQSKLTVNVYDVDRAAARIVGLDTVAVPRPLDKQNVLQWLKNAGINTADVQVTGEAEELVRIIHGLAAGPKGGPPSNLRLLTQQTVHSGPRQLPQAWTWLNWLPLVGAVVPWFAGLFLILRVSTHGVS